MRAPRRLLARIALAAGVCLLAANASAPARAEALAPPSVEVRVVDGVYLLDADTDIRLTPPVQKALENGVTLSFAWEVEIGRERNWWFEAEVADVAQRYRLEYHDLSLQYLVTNLNTGERRGFTTRRGALAFIGRLTGFPIVDRVLLDEPARHTGYVRLRLEHGTLPLPLRPAALFSPDWHLTTDWREWSFE